MYMKFESDVEAELIVEMLKENTSEDLLQLVLELDRNVGETQFTENLILSLIASLAQEGYDKKDWDQFFNQINKLK